MKRLTPENRRENRAVEQFAQLAFGVWRALAEGRPVGAGPDAAPGGNHDDHPSLGRRDPPRFFEERLRSLGRLQRMRNKEAVNGSVGEREHVGPDERG